MSTDSAGEKPDGCNKKFVSVDDSGCGLEPHQNVFEVTEMFRPNSGKVNWRPTHADSKELIAVGEAVQRLLQFDS